MVWAEASRWTTGPNNEEAGWYAPHARAATPAGTPAITGYQGAIMRTGDGVRPLGSGQARERHVDVALAGLALPPLHQNGALIASLDDGAAAGRLEIGDEQAHAPFHLQEAASGEPDGARGDLLDKRFVQMQRIADAVEHPDEVVFCVIDRPGRNRPGVRKHVAPLLGHEPHRIADHVGEIVTHQERFVFIDRQSDLMLPGAETEADASLRDAVLRDQFLKAVVEAGGRCFEIHRIDGMR